MTLKQQIEATIQVYEEACKPENLNWEYCFNNDLGIGICHFLHRKKYMDLYLKINTDLKSNYLCMNTYDIFFNKKHLIYRGYKDTNFYTLIEAHQIRLNYLRNLLNTLPNDSDN